MFYPQKLFKLAFLYLKCSVLGKEYHMEAPNSHQPCYFLCCPVITSCILFSCVMSYSCHYHERLFPEIMRLSLNDVLCFPENTSFLQGSQERFVYYGVPE